MGRRIAVLLCLSLAYAPDARAYYTPIMLAEVVATADLIVVGQIRSVNATDFRFVATETLKGFADTSFPLRIQRFADWSCASRWTPYRTGQRLVLFLRWTPQGTGEAPLRVVGAGDEGEVPIQGDRAYFQIPEETWGHPHSHQVWGADFHGASVPLSALIDAVRDYALMYEWTFRFRDWPQIRRHAAPVVLNRYVSRSEVHLRLVRQTIDYRALMAKW
jgi:hypothetical protein